MKRIALLLLLLLLCTLAVACGTDNGPYITFAENGVLSARQSTKEAGTLRVPSPAGMHAAYCVGWQATVGDTTVFLPVGATYAFEAETRVHFSPVYLHLTTKTEATVDVATMGLSFTTELGDTEWQAVKKLDPNAACGTLILPTADANTLESALTHDALESNQKIAVDKAATAISNTFNGTIENIAFADIFTKYTAVGYAKITYTNGDTRYFYASFEAEKAPNASLIHLASVQSTLSLITSAKPSIDPLTGNVRFISSLDAEKWRAYPLELITLTCGTLFASAEALQEANGTLTHAALQAAGYTPREAIAHSWYAEEEGKLYFEGVLTDIEDHDRLQKLHAIGFVKITYKNGETDYVYADYSDTYTPFSVMDLVTIAKNDLSDTENDAYPYAAGDKFSPYTAEEQLALEELSKISLLLLYTKKSPSKKALSTKHLTYFNEYNVEFIENAWSAEIDEIWKALGNILYADGAALVITLKDGTPLTEDMIGTLTLQNGSITATVTNYICHNGKLIIPHSNVIIIPR